MIGGNGFVGSHVVDALARDGHDVRVFDRFSNGRARFEAGNVERVTGDFMNVGEVKEAVRDREIVFHFLSTTTPATAEIDPLLDVRTNITSSIELFRACAELGVEHVYFASSGGAIYGDTSAVSLSESTTPNPISPYAIGKLTIEGYLRYFGRTAGLRSTALRISNPFGPRQHRDRKQGVIPIFLRSIARGEPIVVYGDGSMVRDYIYVEDVADMICAMVGKPSAGPVVNIGSGTPYSVNEIVDVVAAVTGIQPMTERRATPPTFVERVVLDTSTYRSHFGTPKHTPLREGIEATWASLMTEMSILV
ncbi:NAD-dependent epimerase/dehydratase family protein [Microbacterium pullorum]|uniref:NAD-dependent epimerase/dehydratase family protein n=1 Tax=Microbacterium pullorum TaxID=2762236 RepID=UPI00296B42A7|nr:NAD-dependent epimerase/dehydratase family protein [Microbacterium pullorum]